MKKTVFITGITGIMGIETLKKFLENEDSFNIRVLARESEVNREKMAEYESRVEVLWGDLRDPEILRKGVRGADYVIAIGAFVSPKADAFPEETMMTNYGSTLAMIKAIREFGQTDTTHYINIGSVAMTGDRMPPIHWGRIGDPMKPAVYDYYAVSKVFAERAVIESGLKYWVSIRQTGMMPPDPRGNQYPIGSHQPMNNVLEWSSSVDSGNLMRNICTNAPEEFWRRCYNLSGGKEFRVSAAQQTLRMGGNFRDTTEPNWHALYNFHGQFYLDSDELEALVPFRTMSYWETLKYVGDYYRNYFGMQYKKAAIEAAKAGKAFTPPTPLTNEQKKENTRAVWSKKGGTLQFVADNDEERIRVWYGSREKFEAIPKSWDEVNLYVPLDFPHKPLSRGFDESKDKSQLNIGDMKQAASFRGGECISETMIPGDLYTDLKWRCAQGHEFTASPYAVLFAGHWCEDCMSTQWRYCDMRFLRLILLSGGA